jgi:ribose/xylose/arabinose/galactoside ABC-type transport system permease subunit
MLSAKTPRRRFDLAQVGLAISVLLTFFISLCLIPQFKNPENLTNIIIRLTPLYSVALGQGLVMLVGAIDLSVGASISLVTAIASILMSRSIAEAIIMCCAAIFAISLFNGIFVGKFNFNPFIVTLSTMYVIKGITLYIRPQPGGVIPKNYIALVLGRWNNIPIGPIFYLLFLVAIGWVVTYKTIYGRKMFAIGGEKKAAEYMGIDCSRYMIISYLLSGAFVLFTGLYMAARIGCGDPAVGEPYTLDSIGAAALGGTLLTGGKINPLGVLWGSLAFTLINNIFNLLGISIYYQYVFKGIIIVFVLAIPLLSTKMKEIVWGK